MGFLALFGGFGCFVYDLNADLIAYVGGELYCASKEAMQKEAVWVEGTESRVWRFIGPAEFRHIIASPRIYSKRNIKIVTARGCVLKLGHPSMQRLLW